MDIAECTLNGERYRAAEFAQLAPKKLAELRQHLRCPDTQCHAKAQFRKASADGKAACFAAKHAPGCTIEDEYPSAGRAKADARSAPASSRSAAAAKPARSAKATAKAGTRAKPANAKASARSKAAGSRGGTPSRGRSGLGKPVLREETTAKLEAEALGLAPAEFPPREALAVHIATPSAVARDEVTEDVPLVPAVIEILLTAHPVGEMAIDPLQFWASKRGERVAGLPRFDLTSLATRLAEDPSIAKLPSVVMAAGMSGFELREFLVRTDVLSHYDVGRKRAYWGRIERLRQAGGGLYLDSGKLGVLVPAETVQDIKSRRAGLTDDWDSWLGALLLVVGDPVPGEGERLMLTADIPDRIVVITDSAPASDTLPLVRAEEASGDQGISAANEAGRANDGAGAAAVTVAAGSAGHEQAAYAEPDPDAAAAAPAVVDAEMVVVSMEPEGAPEPAAWYEAGSQPQPGHDPAGDAALEAEAEAEAELAQAAEGPGLEAEAGGGGDKPAT